MFTAFIFPTKCYLPLFPFSEIELFASDSCINLIFFSLVLTDRKSIACMEHV